MAQFSSKFIKSPEKLLRKNGINYGVGSQPRSIAGADFNGDGMMDIAVVLYQKKILEVFLRKATAPKMAL